MSSRVEKTHNLYVKGPNSRYRIAEPDQILEAARIVVDGRMRRGISLKAPAVAGEFFRERLAGYEREVFAVALLDTRNRLIDYKEMFQGTIDAAVVHPREVAKQALRSNATAVIVAHNHPSGDSAPSAADRALTARLKQALALVEVRLLDHFVVGGQHVRSLAAQGLV